jgi:acetyl esterase/lipase
MKKLSSMLALAMVTTINVLAQQPVIPLYEGAAPGSESWNWTEKENDNNLFNTKVVYNVTRPTLTVFKPAADIANGSAIIICPGGGFHTLSINSEGFDVARWLVKKGVTCFVLKYRLVQSLTDNPVQELMNKMGKPDFEEQTKAIIPMAIQDGREAIAYVRKNARSLGIDENRIGITGFSAGGTIAASAAFNYTPANKPSFVAPIYPFMPPAMTGNVDKQTPPLFVAAASDDQLGLAPHSAELYKKWLDAQVPAELHMYVKGGHGFGMKVQQLPSDSWIDRFGEWLALTGFLKK